MLRVFLIFNKVYVKGTIMAFQISIGVIQLQRWVNFTNYINGSIFTNFYISMLKTIHVCIHGMFLMWTLTSIEIENPEISNNFTKKNIWFRSALAISYSWRFHCTHKVGLLILELGL